MLSSKLYSSSTVLAYSVFALIRLFGHSQILPTVAALASFDQLIRHLHLYLKLHNKISQAIKADAQRKAMVDSIRAVDFGSPTNTGAMPSEVAIFVGLPPRLCLSTKVRSKK